MTDVTKRVRGRLRPKLFANAAIAVLTLLPSVAPRIAAAVPRSAQNARNLSSATCQRDGHDEFPFFVVPPSEAALSSIREAMSMLPEAGRRIIYLRTGNYRLTSSLILSPLSRDLTITACPGETPVLESNDHDPAILLRGVKHASVTGLVFAAGSAAQLELQDTKDCLIADNTFLSGGTSVLMTNSSKNTIRHNMIRGPEATGIELKDGSNANIITDNIIDGARAPETKGGGIFLHGVSFNHISHNLIENAAGFGIGLCNWDKVTVNVANVVDHNLIRNTALSAKDSGGIYVLGRSGIDSRVVIAGNVIDGVGAAGNHAIGIYLDDSTNGAIVMNNLVRSPRAYAVQIHGGSDNRVENNLLDLSENGRAVLFQSAPADTNPLNAQTGNAVLGNLILAASQNFLPFDWLDGGSPRITGNIFANVTGSGKPRFAEMADSKPFMIEVPAARDGEYGSLQAAASKFGFHPIDTRLAGPRGWDLSRLPPTSQIGPKSPQ